MDLKDLERKMVSEAGKELIKSVRERAGEVEEVSKIFDDLSTEIYYGFNFKMFLLENPQALKEIQAIIQGVKTARERK